MALKLLKKKNYLTMIENSVQGPNYLFRNLYAEVDGQEKDLLDDGRWSCAIFVSTILYLFKLIGDLHANVTSTTKDMLSSGWYEINELREGAVLVWESKLGDDDGKMHSHNGFYLGGDMAISNDSKGTGFPWKHHYTYDGTRKIEKIYWHDSLNNG
jgi:hypothetical protein